MLLSQTMNDKLNSKIVIIGGGIAGLWLANTLKKNNQNNFVLLENAKLGTGQTIHSQGIIHGGLKYALDGNLSKDTENIKDMPNLWKKCIDHHTPLSLKNIEILSNYQYMWSNNLLGNIRNLFASKTLRSRVNKISNSDFAKILNINKFTGSVYALEEIILDIKSLVKSLSDNVWDHIIKIEDIKINYNDNNSGINYLSTIINNQAIDITAENYIFTAGKSNDVLTKKLFPEQKIMQTRPLHQTMIADHNLPKLYAHNISTSMQPVVTITTHTNKYNKPVWYIGGKLSEDGINKKAEDQIVCTFKLIKKLFPDLKLKKPNYGSCYIERAEHYQKDQQKPSTISVLQKNNAIVAWPTKLALAPILANKILPMIQDKITDKKYNTINNNQEKIKKFPKPEIADYPWDQDINWYV